MRNNLTYLARYIKGFESIGVSSYYVPHMTLYAEYSRLSAICDVVCQAQALITIYFHGITTEPNILIDAEKPLLYCPPLFRTRSWILVSFSQASSWVGWLA
jgi:hypothetical protein